MHPADALRGTKSKKLVGKRIVLGITGSIAAVECFELARELTRHGAQVHAVVTADALKLVTPWAMEFATGNPVIDEIDGRVQHVSLLGDTPDKADLLLIAPCTANTISKIACGIDDTTVTTMATIAIGSHAPIIIAPAMHLAMYENPLVMKNVETLRQAGIEFVGPRIADKKAKIASNEEIVEAVIRRLSNNDLAGRKVLVIGGSSEEPIDDMRVITNKGTGESAVAIARAAYERGADVDLWMGHATVPMPSFLRVKRFSAVEDLTPLLDNIDHGIVIVPAALSDFAPAKAEGKISSLRSEVELKLCALPKVIDELKRTGRVVVAFKAESNVTRDKLVHKARERLRSSSVDLVVANDLKDVHEGRTRAIIVRKRGERDVEGTKEELANALLDEILSL